VKEHHRKLKKLAKKKTQGLGTSTSQLNKTTRIPNLYPNKAEMLEEQENQKHFDALLKAQKKNEITQEDIDKLVVEMDDYKVIREKIEEFDVQHKKVTKSEYKRLLNQMVAISDVCIQVVDARDPFNFRSKELETNVLKNKKKMIILLTKVDLVSK
jgi:nuclear GTP-binding protein